MFKKVEALSKEDKMFGDYVPLVKGLYILTVKEAEEGTTDERVWEGSGFVNTGNQVPQLTLKFVCETEKGENEIANLKGDVLVNPTYTVWVSDANLGWNRKTNQPKQGRAVLAALLNVAVDGILDYGKSEDLIGKKMKVYMSTETTKAGKERNVLVDIIPV